MGKIETWEVSNRADESISFLFKRRNFREDQFTLSSGGRRKARRQEEDGLDEETRAVLKNLSELNTKIRTTYQFDRTKMENSGKSKKEEEEKESPKGTCSDFSDYSDFPSHSSSLSAFEEEIKREHSRKKSSEPCDHRGIPLSHPLAVTPYPGATTAAQREKARQMLKEIAKRMHEQEEAEKKSKTSSSEPSNNSEASTKSSKKSSNKKLGCDKCGSCQKCVHRCSQKHRAEQKVTDAEREHFLKSIQRLRKKIQKPERSREKATKSPYDVTQSSSEISLNSGSRMGSKKKSLE